MLRRAISTAAFWMLTMANAPAAGAEFSAGDREWDRGGVESCQFRHGEACPREHRHRIERVRVSFPTYVGDRYAFFAAPALNGVAVDKCLDGRLMRCGAPAADAFCQRAGLYKARFFVTTFGRGPTVRADTARADDDSRRGVLANVMCVI